MHNSRTRCLSTVALALIDPPRCRAQQVLASSPGRTCKRTTFVRGTAATRTCGRRDGHALESPSHGTTADCKLHYPPFDSAAFAQALAAPTPCISYLCYQHSACELTCTFKDGRYVVGTQLRRSTRFDVRSQAPLIRHATLPNSKVFLYRVSIAHRQLTLSAEVENISI